MDYGCEEGFSALYRFKGHTIGAEETWLYRDIVWVDKFSTREPLMKVPRVCPERNFIPAGWYSVLIPDMGGVIVLYGESMGDNRVWVSSRCLKKQTLERLSSDGDEK